VSQNSEAAMTSSPFSTGAIELASAGGHSLRLLPLEPHSVRPLAEALAAMEPWSVMNISADRLAAFLTNPDGALCRYVVSLDGADAGVVSIRFPWLKGPYLELLALLPQAQDRGIGKTIMAWLEVTARRHEARNLWVCASSSNAKALRFYERHGFEAVGTLPDLVAEGYDEILLRKFPL